MTTGEMQLNNQAKNEDKKDQRKGPVKKRSGSYHHGNLRQALIQAATEILEDEGIQALSLRATARRAGVSQTAPYRHFSDKSALLAAVAEVGFRRLTEASTTAASKTADPRDLIPNLGKAYVTFAMNHPNLLRLMFGPEIQGKKASDTLSQVSQGSFGIIQRAVTTRLALPDAENLDPLLATVGAWALVHGLSTLLLDGNLKRGLENSGVTVAQLTDVVTNIYTRGMSQ